MFIFYATLVLGNKWFHNQYYAVKAQGKMIENSKYVVIYSCTHAYVCVCVAGMRTSGFSTAFREAFNVVLRILFDSCHIVFIVSPFVYFPAS